MPEVLAEPEPIAIEIPQKVTTGGPHGGGPRDVDPGRRGGGGGDDDDHEAEGASPGKVQGTGLLAVRFMLVSITVLFVTIAVVYFARSRSRIHWDPVAVPSFLWVSTALIVASSWTLERARRAFAQFRIDSYAHWLLTTFFLGLAFLMSQLMALRQLIGQGVYLRRNPHSSLFYVVTGAHAVHLLGGMAALFYMVIRASTSMRDMREELGRQRTLVSASTLYWHFLDALWAGLFVLLLLWS